MKKCIKLVLVLVLFTTLVVTTVGCAKCKVITIEDKDGSPITATFKPYGLFNPSDKNPNVEYKVSVGNIIRSALTIEFLVIPVILIGWHLYEPIGPKTQDGNIIPGVK